MKYWVIPCKGCGTSIGAPAQWWLEAAYDNGSRVICMECICGVSNEGNPFEVASAIIERYGAAHVEGVMREMGLCDRAPKPGQWPELAFEEWGKK